MIIIFYPLRYTPAAYLYEEQNLQFSLRLSLEIFEFQCYFIANKSNYLFILISALIIDLGFDSIK